MNIKYEMPQTNIEEDCNIWTWKYTVNEPSFAGNIFYQFQFRRSNLESIQHVFFPLKLNDDKNRTTLKMDKDICYKKQTL